MFKSKSSQVILANIVFIVFLAAALGFVYQTFNSKQEVNSSKNTVIVTSYPIYEFTKTIAGDKLQVSSLLSPGIEPHEFEPTANQVQSIYDSKLLILNGAGFESWLEELGPELEQKGVQKLNLSEHIDLLHSAESVDEDGHNHNIKDVDHTADPHFWLDPSLVVKQIDLISDKLSEISPESKIEFTENGEKFKRELLDLDKQYSENLKNCKQKTIITSHKAFNYLAKRYDFQIKSITNFSPEVEPSTAQLKELADNVKARGIKYIFFESLVSPEMANTLALETGAQTLALNPIENLTQEELKNSKNYMNLMKDNLKNLKIAMECE